MLTGYEILKFCYSINSKSAVGNTFCLIKEILSTWTGVQGICILNNKEYFNPEDGVSNIYMDKWCCSYYLLILFYIIYSLLSPFI